MANQSMHTMKVEGFVKNHYVRILLGLGSAHNFIDSGYGIYLSLSEYDDEVGEYSSP